MLNTTPLYDWHTDHGGRMVDFAGWSMPVQYTSIIEEHLTTRSAVGLFDVSHMGRLTFHGDRAEEFLDRVVTRRIAGTSVGAIRYSLIVNHEGGILDDVLVYHIPGIADADYQMVVNAGNRLKIVDWLERQTKELDFGDVEIVDRTADTAMIAIQGPLAIGLMEPLVECDLADIKYYNGQLATIAGRQGMISRTGYTGEDGCEIIVGADHAAEIWETILAAGKDNGAMAAGLGSRDTLRLEAALPLYGHELTEATNPVQAGLRFAYNLKDREFIGREAIQRFQQDPRQPRRVGLHVAGKRVPREQYEVFSADERVGYVTSGTFSPTLARTIAMAYVDPDHAADGTKLAVDIRGTRQHAEVVPLPFYRRT